MGPGAAEISDSNLCASIPLFDSLQFLRKFKLLPVNRIGNHVTALAEQLDPPGKRLRGAGGVIAQKKRLPHSLKPLDRLLSVPFTKCGKTVKKVSRFRFENQVINIKDCRNTAT